MQDSPFSLPSIAQGYLCRKVLKAVLEKEKKMKVD
jgi:hypothetical protein